MRLVRIVKKGSKTILQRPYRKHEKNTEDNKAHRKCKQLQGKSFSLKKGK